MTLTVGFGRRRPLLRLTFEEGGLRAVREGGFVLLQLYDRRKLKVLKEAAMIIWSFCVD